MAQGTPPPGWGQGSFPVYKNAPLPPDNTSVLARHAYTQAMSALRMQKRNTLEYYGYTPKGRIDPHNVYGAFQMQSRQQGQAMEDLYGGQQQSGFGGFGVGQRGGTGLARQQKNQALFGMGYEQQQLMKEFQDKMDAIRLGMREAKWVRREKQGEGTLQSIIAAITSGQFTPASPAY